MPTRTALTSACMALAATVVATVGVPTAMGIEPRATAAATPATAATAWSGHPTEAESSDRAVVSQRIFGYSVNRHPMRAYQLGNPNAATTAVVLAAMHGNEKAGSVVLSTLRQGAPVKGVNLWVIPRDNVDGYLSDNRHNAHGVDLNRNFPTSWIRQTGYYYSGRRPASEPETRALMRFLNKIDPRFVVTIHSPLYGVEVRGAKNPIFARRLARQLGLPKKEFNCNGGCHGTLTQWFNAHHRGSCVTVEFGSSPSWRYLHVRAPRAIVRAVGGHF
ncbi:MAG: M14 family zinc carboxypeptidase [Nocardioidaceae bacterium]